MSRLYPLNRKLEKQLETLNTSIDGLAEFAVLRQDLARNLEVFNNVFSTEHTEDVRTAASIMAIRALHDILQLKLVVLDILSNLYDSATTLTTLQNAVFIAQSLNSPEAKEVIEKAFPVLSFHEAGERSV